ncbi:MAG: two-component system response regulator [Spirochaetes bacterium GWF1_41_5]|nr:MAG: two-component system response regulator [Spirochaetes bacterium GWF1_41_5]
MPQVYIVDDSATTRASVDYTLAKAEYKVTACESGPDALAKIAASTEKIDLFICDVNMPEMDGIALVKEIRKIEKCKFTPILMLTTEAQESKKLEGKQAGASGWLVKPFNPDQLVEIVKRFVR